MRTIRILVTLLLICVSTSFAQTTSSPTVAFVYLGGRESEHPIRAFSLQANGSVRPVPGSPFTDAALRVPFPRHPSRQAPTLCSPPTQSTLQRLDEV